MTENTNVEQRYNERVRDTKLNRFFFDWLFCQLVLFKIKVLLLVGFLQLCSTKFILPFSILLSGLEELFNTNRMTHKVTIHCQDGNLKKKACLYWILLSYSYFLVFSYLWQKVDCNFMGSVNLVDEHIWKSEHLFSTYRYSKQFSPRTPCFKILANIHMIT